MGNEVIKEDVSISVVYDDKYLGEGYFIIYERGGEIHKFIKIYQYGEMGFPRFYVRGYERGAKDRWDQEFRELSLEVSDSQNEELKDSLVRLGSDLNGRKVYTVDFDNQGTNHLEVRCEENVSIVLSKSVYKGKDLSSNYIDIVLGDDYSCGDYSSFQRFYNDLSRIANRSVDNGQVLSKILNVK